MQRFLYRWLVVLIMLIAAYIPSGAQLPFSRYVIELKDKQDNPFRIDHPSDFLSQRAIERRQRYGIPIDSTDLPVTPAYLQAIAAIPKVSILNASKWLNQVLVKIGDSAALLAIEALPFVKGSSAVAHSAFPNNPDIPEKKQEKWNDSIRRLPPAEVLSGAYGTHGSMGNSSLSYGSTYGQIHIHEGEYLHNHGFTGEGMVIAMLDAGYLFYTTNKALDSARLQGRILGTWDFVKNEASVTEDDGHGSICLSTMAANIPGKLVGTAPHASFWLLRTEDAGSEYPIELQYWAAGAEYADSAGADIISSSLGYTSFDDTSLNLTYAMRDGKTSIATRAANMAFHKGMIVTVSAGNSGRLLTEYKYVSSPADGDSVLAVGATNPDGVIASFSSWGPNAAGKIKPDIVSVGQPTVIADIYGNPATANGTSVSNPNVCGLIACLWEAFPEFCNRDIVDAVKRSADRYNQPDGRYGYGIPNFRIAYGLLQYKRDVIAWNGILGPRWISANPSPFSNDELRVILKAPHSASASLQLLEASGRILEALSIKVQEGQTYMFRFNNSARLAAGIYLIHFNDGQQKASLKVMKQ
ncbi:MAG TPA: S8 family peptidase [Chitinophagaceae bacterium]|nr:S8 family peptidase [Chitinophagaceae bacterium]